MSPAETALAFVWRSLRSFCARVIWTTLVARSRSASRKHVWIPSSSVTAEDLAEAANIFLAMHDFDLAEQYFDKAQLAGANNRTVAIGLTNTYLAEGNTRKAEATLASLGPANDFRDDYDYMMASANLYRQRQDPLHALVGIRAGQHGGRPAGSGSRRDRTVRSGRPGRPSDQRQSQLRPRGFLRRRSRRHQCLHAGRENPRRT